MRAIAPLHAGPGRASKASAASLRAVEKTSRSSALSRDREDAREEPESAAPLRVELVSHNDTPRFDPYWDAPRLLPTFVAQLLGQAMPQRRESVSVENTYGREATPPIALVVDRQS